MEYLSRIADEQLTFKLEAFAGKIRHQLGAIEPCRDVQGVNSKRVVLHFLTK